MEQPSVGRVVVPDDAVSGPILTPVLRIERVGFGHPDALLLIEAVQEEYVARYGGRDATPLDPLMFEPPAGSFYVGYVDDVPVASGAWRRRGDVEAFGTTEAAEIKRMYVATAARGTGARPHHARPPREDRGSGGCPGDGARDRHRAARGDRASTTSSGYTPIEPFGHYKWSPENRCFAKLLP